MALNRGIDGLGLEYAQRFTDAYKKTGNVYEREVLCEDIQFPAVLLPPDESLLLCGRRIYPEVGYSPQYGGLGYYFSPPLKKNGPEDIPAEEKEAWAELERFWETECTQAKCWASFDPAVRERMPLPFGEGLWECPAYPLYRMGGLQLDYAKLVNQGLSGLRGRVSSALETTDSEEAEGFFRAALASVNRTERVIQYYLGEAEKLPPSPGRNRLIGALEDCSEPKTFHGALQLIQIVLTMSGTLSYGRLDAVLGPFLRRDLDEGRLTWEEALEVMEDFYRLLEKEIAHWDGRIILGGRGRENEADADLFALLAMETTGRLSLPLPQLSLRFYQGQNPALLDKAYRVIGRGKTFPMLYNDDVNIPAVMKAFDLSRAEAEQYLPFGCGEYMINHRSCGTPNFIINLQMCLNLAMNHGKSFFSGRAWAPDFGGLTDYGSLEELWSSYERTVSHFLEVGARGQEAIYKAVGRECPYSLISLLYDDCLALGKPIFSGGVRYLGGTNETYGNTNAADSLTAAGELVFNTGRYTAEELLTALRENWSGYEKMRKDFLAAPKYGNDDGRADAMVERVHNHICRSTSDAARERDLHHFLVVVINNNANTTWGLATGASADGRRSGTPLAPGNAPSAGSDRCGLTALLNSQAKPDPSLHAGAVQNVKIAAVLPRKKASLYRAFMEGYWRQGGSQLMVNVTSREDLEDALTHPENHPDLLVRVGGFTARFIDLDKPTQQEVLSRTEHVG